jgi:hypothetical protein
MAIQKVHELGGGSRLERVFIAALEKFYANADTIDYPNRLLAKPLRFPEARATLFRPHCGRQV